MISLINIFDALYRVMIRLNMLTLVLAYTMDADYLFYYFAPLVSMWFIIIYATLAVASHSMTEPRFLSANLYYRLRCYLVHEQNGC